MSPEIQTLWELHELDDQVVAIDAALARFPAERAALAQRVAEERKHLETLKTRHGEAQKKRRDLEREVTALSETEKRFQTQLTAVKKNEEYQALLHEIASTRARRSDLETEILMALESEDEVQRERPRVEQELQGIEREAQSRLATLEQEEARDREARAGLEAQRAERVTRLPQQTRSRYERVRTGRGGRAVVAILKGACSGCFRAQPPQALQEARGGDRLLYCEGCGRMLIWPPNATTAG